MRSAPLAEVWEAGRALFGTTTVIDEAFDEVSLKVKRADIDERLGGKGQLSTIVQQQNSRVKKVEARREKKERKSEIEEERAAARRKRRERLAKENAEIDQKLDAARRKFDDGKQKADAEPEGGRGRKSKEVLLRTAKSGEGPRQRRRSRTALTSPRPLLTGTALTMGRLWWRSPSPPATPRRSSCSSSSSFFSCTWRASRSWRV